MATGLSRKECIVNPSKRIADAYDLLEQATGKKINRVDVELVAALEAELAQAKAENAELHDDYTRLGEVLSKAEGENVRLIALMGLKGATDDAHA
jgi:hypothetical protein